MTVRTGSTGEAGERERRRGGTYFDGLGAGSNFSPGDGLVGARARVGAVEFLACVLRGGVGKRGRRGGGGGRTM